MVWTWCRDSVRFYTRDPAWTGIVGGRRSTGMTKHAEQNIGEGRSRAGDAGRDHCRIAWGRAAETCALLDLVVLPGAAERQQALRRVGATLAALARWAAPPRPDVATPPRVDHPAAPWPARCPPGGVARSISDTLRCA